ncbi:TonB-dependent receptor [Litorivivens sp.]|uniref:TonB-dependent receptor n=1 Tax=Litorivivens sp. TaxID=2020868 RepID=UPI0035666F01
MKSSVVTSSIRVVSIALLAATTSFSVLADSSASGGEEDAPSGKRVIEEVFVSATKRTKSVRDIPISIDAFTGDDLTEIGATGLEDIVKYSPGVVMSGGNVTIRGLSNAGGLYTRTVGRFYDGVSLINPSVQGVQPHFDPYDIASVEILKGPQGTLFGGSALTGAIRYVPQLPDFERGLSASVSYGHSVMEHSDDSGEAVRAMLNIPVFDNLGLRIVSVDTETPGYVDDTFSGKKDINSTRTDLQRALALWQPIEPLSVQLSWLEFGMAWDGNGFVSGSSDKYDYTRSTQRQPETGEADVEIYGIKLSWAVGDRFDIVLDSNMLKKTQSLRQGLETYLGLEDTGARAPVTNDFWTEQPSHELRLVSNELSGGMWLFRDWEYTVGLFYMESDQFLTGPIRASYPLVGNVPVIPGALGLKDPTAGTNTKIGALAEEKALFFDLTRSFFGKLEVNLGGRYFEQITDGEIHSSQEVENPLGGEGVETDPNGDAPSIAKVTEEKGFNPKVALTWNFTDEVSVIASVADGFRFGGVNTITESTHAISGQPYFFESDSIRNYEIGFRSRWFDRRLTLDAAAFYIPWDNMQVQTNWNGTFQAVDNVGGALVRGAEIAVNAILPWNLNLTANAAHIESKTTEPFESDAEGEVLEGTTLPNAPRWTGSVILSHFTQLGSWTLASNLNYAYQDESKNDFSNSVPLKAFGTWGLSFNLSQPLWRLAPTFRLTANNLLDEKASLGGFTTPTSTLVIPIRPRHLELTTELKF